MSTQQIIIRVLDLMKMKNGEVEVQDGEDKQKATEQATLFLNDIKDSFKNIILLPTGKVYLSRDHDQGVLIEIDINDQNQVDAVGLEDFNVQRARLAMANYLGKDSPVPEDQKHRWHAIFGGKVWHSFDTAEEMEDWKKDAPGLAFSYYTPDVMKNAM